MTLPGEFLSRIHLQSTFGRSESRFPHFPHETKRSGGGVGGEAMLSIILLPRLPNPLPQRLSILLIESHLFLLN